MFTPFNYQRGCSRVTTPLNFPSRYLQLVPKSWLVFVSSKGEVCMLCPGALIMGYHALVRVMERTCHFLDSEVSLSLCYDRKATLSAPPFFKNELML